MFVVRYKKIFFGLTLLITIAAIAAMVTFGFNVGIDFKGGSLLEVSYPKAAENTTLRPNVDAVKTRIDALNLGNYSVRPSSDDRFVVRTKNLSLEEKNKLVQALTVGSSVPKEEQFTTIGPIAGKELRNKAFVAIVVAILGIVLFVTFAFRKVSEPVASWKYGVATIVALVHDVIVPAGFFVAWTHWFGGEIDLLFVTALLAILGYSVHDTIVVFDRVRENLRINRDRRLREDFETTVGKSISQTFGRSINTSLTIFLVLVALYFIGGESTRDFALVLLVGVIAGTYSSIFLANPLLVWFARLGKKNTQ